MRKKSIVVTLSLIIALVIPLFLNDKIPRVYSDTLELDINNGDFRISKYRYFFCYSRKTQKTIFSKYITQSDQEAKWEEVTASNRLKHVLFLKKMLEEIKMYGENDENMAKYVKHVMAILKEDHSNVALDYVNEKWSEWVAKQP